MAVPGKDEAVPGLAGRHDRSVHPARGPIDQEPGAVCAKSSGSKLLCLLEGALRMSQPGEPMDVMLEDLRKGSDTPFAYGMDSHMLALGLCEGNERWSGSGWCRVL